jgi:uncharacterized protein YndB with AHSA1/START domain
MSSQGRTVDVSIDIDAAIEDVWAAIATADHLTRWLPTDARIDARPGGRFTISWEGGWQWDMRVDACDPPRRLRLIDQQARPFDIDGQPLDATAPVELVLEFTLASDHGRTHLRLVHSGFGHGGSWDDEVDGVGLGWQSELRGLKEYLERHAGHDRRLGWARAGSDEPAEARWAQLTAPGGLIASGDIDRPAGDRVRLVLTTGDVIEGVVLFAVPGRQLLVRAENLGGSVFRLATDRAGGRSLTQVTLSSWRMAPGQVGAFAARVQAALEPPVRVNL